MLEVEVRSFLSPEEYQKLLEYFQIQAEFINEDYQETFYFDCEEDLRIQKNNFFSKIWLKQGKLHADSREELEIKFDRDQFEQLERLFLSLGYQVEIKWFRNRHRFNWNRIKVCLDYTKGYGHIIELEQLASPKDKDKVLELLKQKMFSLNIKPSPKAEFDQKYLYYKENWPELVK